MFGCLTLIIPLVQGMIIFPHQTQLSLPVDFPPNIAFYQLIAIQDGVQGGRKAIKYNIDRITKFSANNSRTYRKELFAINSSNGEISLRHQLRKGYINKSFTIRFTANIKTNLLLLINISRPINKTCELRPGFCFLSPDVTYRLLETTAIGTTFDSLMPMIPSHFCHYNLSYAVQRGSEIVQIDSETGKLSLRAEKATRTNFSIICQVQSSDEIEKYVMEGSIKVDNSSDNTQQPRDIYEVALTTNVALNSRVIQPFNVSIGDGYSFQLRSTEITRKIFNVTHRTGIIYISNITALQADSYHLILDWNSMNGDGQINISVNITNQDTFSKIPPCELDDMCAMFANEFLCETSCGRGSITGKCNWRNAVRANHSENKGAQPTSIYATCSPDINTCPNRICDELEKLDRHICPQDCTRSIIGEGSLNFETDMGIFMAVETCTCDNIDCYCLSDRSSKSLNRLDGPGVSIKGTTACGRGCVAGIFLCTSSLLILFGMFISLRWVRNYKLNQEKHKYVGSRMSLSAVLSDYVDEQSSVGDCQTMSDSLSGKVDPKWEFPRQNLILEQTLGEGEFGKVMRAQAWGITGSQGYTTVAVKMLKGNGTTAEQQDLLSEFNMLKEVSHLNVIRLLGACTQKGGPFYLIVEYAEYGSLRSYLRKSRRLAFETSQNFRSVWNPTYTIENGDICRPSLSHLCQRDLLSFAWQIAKGMAYLSDMKLLHRDLAARNVLLAAGKVIKVSDFGLSRDVYEGDTYLKKSKGRVPVKWMAIESLEDHIYTTKSDVWSFGIVLWEIVTLGASPYPGITLDRFFPLLKSGYRMDKPGNCSEKLYKIMLLCWHHNPHERPSFKQLVQMFDGMLQDTVEYLTLCPASPDGILAWNNNEDSQEDGEDGKFSKGSTISSNASESTNLLSKTRTVFSNNNPFAQL